VVVAGSDGTILALPIVVYILRGLPSHFLRKLLCSDKVVPPLSQELFKKEMCSCNSHNNLMRKEFVFLTEQMRKLRLTETRY
jgi:hypothetical protein